MVFNQNNNANTLEFQLHLKSNKTNFTEISRTVIVADHKENSHLLAILYKLIEQNNEMLS